MKIATIALGLILAALTFLPVARGEPDTHPDDTGVPEKLADLLEAAFRANPDIRLAEAKLQQARAEVDQVRLASAQRVTSLFEERRQLRGRRKLLATSLEETKSRVRAGVIPTTELMPASLALADADAELAKIEAALRYAVGIGSRTAIRIDIGPVWIEGTAAARPAAPHEIELAMNTRIELGFEPNVAYLTTVLAAIRKQTGDVVQFVQSQSVTKTLETTQTRFALAGETRLRDVLQALADCYRKDDICFVLRDYGVLITTREEARTIHAATIPHDLPYTPER